MTARYGLLLSQAEDGITVAADKVKRVNMHNGNHLGLVQIEPSGHSRRQAQQHQVHQLQQSLLR